jgi:hypothetical protein
VVTLSAITARAYAQQHHFRDTGEYLDLIATVQQAARRAGAAALYSTPPLAADSRPREVEVQPSI